MLRCDTIVDRVENYARIIRGRLLYGDYGNIDSVVYRIFQICSRSWGLSFEIVSKI